MPHVSPQALQIIEVRRECHVGRGCTAPVLHRIIIAFRDLMNVHIVDVRAVQRFRHLVHRIESHSPYDIFLALYYRPNPRGLDCLYASPQPRGDIQQ